MFSVSGFCQGLLEWRTDIQIEVFADGSATWFVQQRTQLTTEEDEAAFWQYLNITSPSDISDNINSMVNYASLVTGRSMRTERLGEVNASVLSKGLSKEGIIKYEFDWLGFADIRTNDRIRVGDVFSGEIDLSRNDVLTIKYPVGCAPVFVYPSPDERHESERTLIWFGPRNLGAGEPMALFEQQSFSWADAIAGSIPILAVILVGVSAGSLGYFSGRKRASGSLRLKSDLGARQIAFSEEGVEDEEKVVKLLKAMGGSAYQSDIASHFGFSKSKASGLLSMMERNGAISRKKMGKGKIVTLLEEQKANSD